MATAKTPTAQTNTDSKKGFAAMDDKKQKEAASKGGKSTGTNAKNHK